MTALCCNRCAASPMTRPTSQAFREVIPGPVLAVGHSYGGAMISNADADTDNVVTWFLVNAFAPDEGERLGEAASTSKDSTLMTALVPLQYPSADGATATEFAIDPAKFHDKRLAPFRSSRPS